MTKASENPQIELLLNLMVNHIKKLESTIYGLRIELLKELDQIKSNIPVRASKGKDSKKRCVRAGNESLNPKNSAVEAVCEAT